MHDKLYTEQEKWSGSTTADVLFTQYAVQMGLDPVQFTNDMKSQEGITFITAQEQAGEKAGIQGTPTFYLNGHLLTNPLDYNAFKSSIEQELK
jgi:protein-disulfide isomerase